jgi:hypothetical protein
VPVALVAGHVEAPEVGLPAAPAVGEVVGHHAEGLEHVAPHAGALVAADAPVRLEERVPLALLGAEGVAVAEQVAIEARGRPVERPLVGGDGVGDVGAADAPLGVNRAERRGVLGQRAQLRQRLGPARGHLVERLDRAVDLRLERLGATVPEVSQVELRVVHARRVDHAHAPRDAH